MIRASSLVERLALEDVTLVASDALEPRDVQGEALAVPRATTVAAALRRTGRWDYDGPSDAQTWWLRARLPAAGRLRLDGLATLADVFVDGRNVLRSENMFHSHVVEVAGRELAIRFSPVAEELAKKRPRPRWKTRLAAHQQLRWVRTSLVGRMPGWSPPVVPIGAWRPIALERGPRHEVDVRTRVEGREGVVCVRANGEGTLVVGDVRAKVSGEATVRIPNVDLWWPHTHGPQPLYPARFEVEGGVLDLGAIGFRTLALDERDGAFTMSVNDVPLFCRGASWTTTDIATLVGDREAYARVLGAMKDAGMNMVRLSGTLFYEEDAFYDVCDELGILVWQDFMFANMDYPADDERFRASVTREANELLARLESHPCLAMLCGGSEVEQQAAMFGAPREIWRGALQAEILPALCRTRCPDVPFCPSTPSGGALPFHVDRGVSHYYGVGAYLRPFDDARRANVRFAAECLAFANVPDDDLFPTFLTYGQAPFVHARWKERTSKDNGASWDFEDVRDHYLRLLFEVDPMRLRYEDVERYLALSRVASGETMARALAELRRPGGSCRGALVWFLQDLWPGAGWGLLDSRGHPKAAYWYVRRALRPRALFFTDEGVNGMHVHAVNDADEPLTGTLHVTFYREGEIVTARGEVEVEVAPRSGATFPVDAMFATFLDSARAYRFGPKPHDVVVASLGALEATHLFDFAAPPRCHGLAATLRGSELTVHTKSFAHAVAVTAPGHVPSDSWFDLAPGAARTVTLRAVAAKPLAVTVTALNAPGALLPKRG